eukprot:TRINITY_DN61521_c0_g1_i1.p1 TRINITY_DN61521_c0_g1~~TRINITY_DN61521_c0_g1_i1.p1  ORF type:complete len:125 (+),score=29.41 TRINITY_DN61521_c0_g1_i1:166-540(+)
MLRSLVGSEMCIRDSLWALAHAICDHHSRAVRSVLVFVLVLEGWGETIPHSWERHCTLKHTQSILNGRCQRSCRVGCARRALPTSLEPLGLSDGGCLLYTSDAADEEDSVDLGGRRIIKKKKKD